MTIDQTIHKPGWKATGQRNEDDKEKTRAPWNLFFRDVATAAVLPSWSASCIKAILGATLALYILNQQHLLPKPISRVVSKALFWPSMPITVVRRLGSWTTVIDDTVVMGGAPFGFAGIPEKLYNQCGVSFLLCFWVFRVFVSIYFSNENDPTGSWRYQSL